MAPLAGWTDAPFRRLVRAFGTPLAVTEMILAQPGLWGSRKTSHRLDLDGEPGARSLQIAGADPEAMAESARLAVDLGADIIDINMGCPAKKVARRAAGSALLSDERLVGRIVRSVVRAVRAPVTLKIRTGPSPDNRNAASIARIARDEGIQMLVIHGRTRACRFNGSAEHGTLRGVVEAVPDLPVIANGDISSVAEALGIIAETGASGVMIGRAALGRPWLPGQIAARLSGRRPPAAPRGEALVECIAGHLGALHRFYGPEQGARIARKHWGWYAERHRPARSAELKKAFNVLTCPQRQIDLVRTAFAPSTTEESVAA